MRPEMMGFGMQWHQLGHMQTLLKTDDHTNTSSLNFFTGQMLFLAPNQQCQSTEGTWILNHITDISNLAIYVVFN